MITQTDISNLTSLLNKAEYLAAQFSGGHSSDFFSAEEFHVALVDSISKFKSGDSLQLSVLKLWFLPTSCWDDFIGKDGQELANQISELLNKMTINETGG